MKDKKGEGGPMQPRPRLSYPKIWNMCFGFFGIQIGFALQNANTSRIFQTLGADIESLPILWIAAPATGLIVQPVIGYLSDRTWGPLGRRRPYFLVGALLTTAALLFMPHAPFVWAAAVCLWLMDASINITMEPFRAFVGDILPDEQRTTGFATQSFFIGLGAVLASAFPTILTRVFHIANTAPAGQIPPSVRIAFTAGAVALLFSVLWTIVTTREYPPEPVSEAGEGDAVARGAASPPRPSGALIRQGLASALIGAAGAGLIAMTPGAKKELYVLAAMAGVFGLLQLLAGMLRSAGREQNPLVELVDDLFAMPKVMRGLAVVQFFSWFGLFAMWIYTTPAVALWHFGSSDPTSSAYNTGADLVNLLFSVYNGVAALAAFALPVLAARIGRKGAHAAALALGGAGLAAFFLIRDPNLLFIPMIGVGVAWASILSAPYSILSGALPPAKMGVYMGIFNIFIVTPQMLAATVLGLLVKGLCGGQPIFALVIGGASFGLAALFSLRLEDLADPARLAGKKKPL
jgi:maltose/moltooligosaccharide transporter